MTEIYPSVGKVVVRFSMLESIVLFSVAALIGGNPEITFALLSEASFSKRLDALKSLAPLLIHDSALIDELEKLIKRLAESEAKRNTVVHTTWAQGPNGLMSLKPTAKRKHGVNSNLRSASIEEIDAIGNHVSESITEYKQFLLKLQERKIVHFDLVG